MTSSKFNSRFESPDGHAYRLMRAQRPGTPFMGEIFPDGLNLGLAEAGRRYGWLSRIGVADINGFDYGRTVTPVPRLRGPEWLQKIEFRVLLKLHPELRRRSRSARIALESRIWRDDLDRWEEEVKPGSIARHLELTAVDVGSISDQELLEHLAGCRRNLIEKWKQHFIFNPAASIPTGDLIAHIERWTGKQASDVSVLLAGSSPSSSGWSPQRDALMEALQSNPEAVEVLESGGEPTEILDRLSAMPDPMGTAIRSYVGLIGYRVMGGIDVTGQYALEMPEVVVDNIRHARMRGGVNESTVAKIAEDRMRALIPPEQHVLFEELLTEARLTCGLRDERGLYSDSLALGVTRRAILEMGSRVAERGRISDVELIFEADWDEMQALLFSQGDPTNDELKARKTYRTTTSREDAPKFVGGVPRDPIPVDWYPNGALRRLMEADGAWRRSIDINAPEQEESSANALSGFAASGGVFEGTARIVMGVHELNRIEQGDVLVTPTTSVAYNIILPKLNAIVTDRGGALCHAAIVSREFGIPAVVGTNKATATIEDGAKIRVDGDTGTVTLL